MLLVSTQRKNVVYYNVLSDYLSLQRDLHCAIHGTISDSSLRNSRFGENFISINSTGSADSFWQDGESGGEFDITFFRLFSVAIIERVIRHKYCNRCVATNIARPLDLLFDFIFNMNRLSPGNFGSTYYANGDPEYFGPQYTSK